MYFDELDLNDNVLDALYDMRFDTCTPVQENVSLRYWKVTTYWAWHRPERVRLQPICSQY